MSLCRRRITFAVLDFFPPAIFTKGASSVVSCASTVGVWVILTERAPGGIYRNSSWVLGRMECLRTAAGLQCFVCGVFFVVCLLSRVYEPQQNLRRIYFECVFVRSDLLYYGSLSLNIPSLLCTVRGDTSFSAPSRPLFFSVI